MCHHEMASHNNACSGGMSLTETMLLLHKTSFVIIKPFPAMVKKNENGFY